MVGDCRTVAQATAAQQGAQHATSNVAKAPCYDQSIEKAVKYLMAKATF